MYFAGESLNDTDLVLKRVPEAERARVVITPDRGTSQGPPAYLFDLVIADA